MTLELPSKVRQSIAEFTGRGWILPRIRTWLDTGSERVFLITGKPGSGKSMISAWLGGEGPPPSAADHARDLEQVRSLVSAVHFCQATSGNSPRAFAESVAKQLARTVDGFAGHVATSLSDRAQVHVTATVNVDRATRAKVTGVELTLELGSLTDEPSFDRVLRAPLTALYGDNRTAPLLIVIDALDESMTYSGTPKIPHLLARLSDLPAPVRIVATTRPDPRVLELFPNAPRLDIFENEPPDASAIESYAYGRLAGVSEPGRRRLAQRIAAAADGQFLYAYLLLNQVAGTLAADVDPNTLKLPAGLSGYYSEYLIRELTVDRTRWHTTIRPVLGVVAVAQGDGLARDQIEGIVAADPAEALETLGQYLEGDPPDGPFRPFHQSLPEFLIELRHVDAAERHGAIARYYDAIRNGAAAYRKWDLYGLRHIATHMDESLQGERAGDVQRVARLVDLVTDPAFRTEHRRRAHDVAAMQLDLQRAIRAASRCDHDDALPLVARIALAAVRFRREELRPEQLFVTARGGRVDEAARGIDLFDASPQWRAAARLALAWAARQSSRAAAGRLRDSVVVDEDEPTLRLLAARVDAGLDRQPLPTLETLPPCPSEEIVRARVDRLGGVSGGGAELLASELVAGPYSSLMAPSANSAEFLAADDGPALVAFALANPAQGDALLREYLSVHTGYQYVHYRQGSLWVLLRAVLAHPDQAWACGMVSELVTSALGGTSAEFEEALPIAIAALQGTDERSEAESLSLRMSAAISAAGELGGGRHADSWGFHKRRLAAIAQAARLDATRQQAVAVALRLPFGFAGFNSPASLNLAEAVRTFASPSDPAIAECLQEALTAAHNIQDESFCLRQTSRVNAMLARWWTPGGFDPAAAVERLLENPLAPEFSTIHIVGGQFQRYNALPMRPIVLAADTLQAIAALHHRDVDDVARANAGAWKTDTVIPAGTPVNVPDPGFATQLAARFAAEILAHPEFDAWDRVNLLRRLVPLASASPTVLDTVLARLVIAARPQGATLEALRQVASSYPQPPPPRPSSPALPA